MGRGPDEDSFITYQGKTQSIREWAAETGIQYATIYGRINNLKWSPHEALTTPARPKGTMRDNTPNAVHLASPLDGILRSLRRIEEASDLYSIMEECEKQIAVLEATKAEAIVKKRAQLAALTAELDRLENS